MENLRFSDAIISNGDSRFTAVAFFDSYFSFCGRKYRVINPCVEKGRRAFLVEETKVKQNVLLKMIVAISFITGLVPLIMALGKWIARSRYKFLVTKTISKPDLKEVRPLASEKQVKQPVEKLDNHVEDFKQKALERLAQGTIEERPLDFPELNEEQKTMLLSESVQRDMLDGYEVLLLEAFPQFVFKPMYEDQAAAKKCIEDVQKARDTILKNRLYLLDLSEAKLFEVKGRYFVMQRKPSVSDWGFPYQKGICSFCWKQKELQDYIKTVFTQLITFISKTSLENYRYGKVAFTEEGRVGLLNFNRYAAYSGIRTLFKQLPEEQIDSFFEIAKAKLEEVAAESLEERLAILRKEAKAKDQQKRLPRLEEQETWNSQQALKGQMNTLKRALPEIKEKAKKRTEKEKDYLEFLKNKGILSVSQKIRDAVPKLFDHENDQALFEYIVDTINKKLSYSKNFSITTGRTARFEMNHIHCPPILEEMKKISEKTGKEFNSRFGDSYSKLTIVGKILEVMKQAGYIHRYKINETYHFIKLSY